LHVRFIIPDLDLDLTVAGLVTSLLSTLSTSTDSWISTHSALHPWSGVLN